jgi:hypothetical protein
MSKETGKHREAFLTWYELDRHFDNTATELRVSNNTLAAWIKKYDWHDRADKLDEKAYSKQAEKVASEKAKKQSEMIENHFKYGTNLISVGGSYLTRKGVDSGAQAVAAIKAGVEIQRTAEGLSTGQQTLNIGNKPGETFQIHRVIKPKANDGD